jgi:hypothetical protein
MTTHDRLACQNERGLEPCRGSLNWRIPREIIMDEGAIDRVAMGRIAKALAFIRGADDPTTVALKTASDTGNAADIKKARVLFMRLKPSDRQGALAMLSDE